MENTKKVVEEIRKEMAELRTQLPQPYAARPATEATASSRTEAPPYRYTCRRYGRIGHFAKDCPSPTFEANQGRLQSPSYTAQKPKNVRSVRSKHFNTCIEVRYRKYRINTLVDTGSDITIAGLDCATKYGWAMYEHPTKLVKLVNNEDMLIEKITYVTLRVGSRNIESDIFITPDMIRLIIGVDWLRKRRHFVWDFDNHRIKLSDGEWIDLRREDGTHSLRQVYVNKDISLSLHSRRK